MTKHEEYERLLQDRDEIEQELDLISDQIRLGLADEDEEDSHITALQNEVMYLTACIEDYELDHS